MNILEEITQYTKARIACKKQQISLDELKKQCKQVAIMDDFVFEKALKTKDIAFICEVKKASPSKGIIDSKFAYVDIARAYEKAQASAISVLTEPKYFQGNDEYLREIAEHVKIPILRKDFIVDEYMIYEAKCLKASAILLICAILTQDQLNTYVELAHTLGLSALVETHNEQEIAMAIAAKARIIGVNNRDLKTFIVDLNTSIELRKQVPPSILFVSESGIQSSHDVEVLRQAKVDAVLVGESLMRSTSIDDTLQALRGIKHE